MIWTKRMTPNLWKKLIIWFYIYWIYITRWACLVWKLKYIQCAIGNRINRAPTFLCWLEILHNLSSFWSSLALFIQTRDRRYLWHKIMYHSDDLSMNLYKKIIFLQKLPHYVFEILSHTSRSHIAIHPDLHLTHKFDSWPCFQFRQLDKEHISLNKSNQICDNHIQHSPEILWAIPFQKIQYIYIYLGNFKRIQRCPTQVLTIKVLRPSHYS